MQIQNITFIRPNRPIRTNIIDNTEIKPQQKNINEPCKYSQIPFGAIYGVKPAKTFLEAEKNNFIKILDDILKTDTSATDPNDRYISAVKKAMGLVKANIKRRKEIMTEIQDLVEDKFLSDKQKFDRCNILKKEYNRLLKNREVTVLLDDLEKPLANKNEDIDYKLINSFKTAVTDDNFDLQGVFQKYYSGLENIKTIEELKEQYPKIKIPPRPEEVFAKKFEAVLIRDFYKDLDSVCLTQDKDKIAKFLETRIKQMVIPVAQKHNVDPEDLNERIGVDIALEILKKYDSYSSKGYLSSIPTVRKVKIPQITDTDIQMLTINYDDFVLSTLRKQYLKSQKFRDINYKTPYTTLNVGKLNTTDYKFEPVSKTTEKLINKGTGLHSSQRKYEVFGITQFAERLDFHASREPGNNEEILGRIIDFATCNHTEEDKKQLIGFLRELDMVIDGKKTVSQALKTIQDKKIEPKGTQKLKELERQKAENDIKIERKRAAQLSSAKKDFDDSVNILYANGLNNLANMCSGYRPKSLDKKELEDAKYLIGIISKGVDFDSKKVLNKEKLEQEITRWNTFNLYKNNETEREIFQKALKYGENPDGKIDIDKAGQYLINSEFVQAYPEGMKYASNPEVLKKIMEKTGSDEESAIRCLCKFDNYTSLPDEEKTHISKLISIFDQKDSVEKMLLKYVVEKDYINTDTSATLYIHKNNIDTVMATLAAKAKQQIIEKYKFPLCMDYFAKFEDALSTYAGANGTSGIKQTGKNNKALEYKMELKILGEDDRLFSSKNDYYFDIFSDRGMH